VADTLCPNVSVGMAPRTEAVMAPITSGHSRQQQNWALSAM
jgi:hypothetical protein